MYSVMWSEHCSYKSSKVHLAKFGELGKETPRGPLLAGIGEQAGVVDVGDGWAVTFKIESHNHPSLRRAVPGRGDRGGRHRPRHPRDGCPPDRRDGRRCVSAPWTPPTPPACCPASWPASAATATASACRTSAARSCSTPPTTATPWSTRCASASCRHDDLHLAFATGTGNKVILYGAATGGDGIGGASILASETFEADGPAKRPAVQVGRPVHGEAADRVHPGALRRRHHRRHPGPRRRRHLVRDLRAGQRRRRRHARRPRPRAAAGLHAGARRRS